jgi:hypothetical protein
MLSGFLVSGALKLLRLHILIARTAGRHLPGVLCIRAPRAACAFLRQRARRLRRRCVWRLLCVCARFAPLVGDSFILYTDDGAGRATCDPNYFNYTRPLWPMAADPHGDGATAVPWAPTAASPAEARL